MFGLGFIKKWWEKRQQQSKLEIELLKKIPDSPDPMGRQPKREYESHFHRVAVILASRWRGTYIHWKAGKYLNDKKNSRGGSPKNFFRYWQSQTDQRRRHAENAEIDYLIEKSEPKLEQYKAEGLIGRK